MKKTTKIILLAIVLTAPTAFAQNTLDPISEKPPSTSARTAKEQVGLMDTAAVNKRIQTREKLLEMKENALQTRTEAKKNQIRERVANNLTERKIAVIKNHTGIMLNRFVAALMRLDTLAERIAGHIAKIEETGRDMTDAKTALGSARDKIASATQSLEELKTALENLIVSENLGETMTEIRKMSEETKTKIKEAHAALVDVISILKPGTREIVQ